MRYYVGTVFYGDDIWHYGVKGQKKGVRRYQNPDGSLKPEGYSHYGRNPNPRKRRTGSELGKKVLAKVKEKGKEFKEKHRRLSQVSDEEVRRRINRLKLENEYLDAKKKHKELSAKKKKQMSEGKKYVLGLLANFTTQVVTKRIDAESRRIMQKEKFENDEKKEKRNKRNEENKNNNETGEGGTPWRARAGNDNSEAKRLQIADASDVSDPYWNRSKRRRGKFVNNDDKWR